MTTILPKRTMDIIAQHYGFSEFVIGVVNDDGLVIEKMWIGWTEVVFSPIYSCVVVIHTNQWIRGWAVEGTDALSFVKENSRTVADFTDSGDYVLEYIDEGHRFESGMTTDGYGISFEIITFAENRYLSVWNADISTDPTSIELERRYYKLREYIYQDYRKPLENKLPKPPNYDIYNSERYVSESPRFREFYFGSGYNKKLSLIRWSTLSKYVVIHHFAKGFNYNGSFDLQYTNNPIEFLLLCDIYIGINDEDSPTPEFTKYKGWYSFIKTQNWFRGKISNRELIMDLPSPPRLDEWFSETAYYNDGPIDFPMTIQLISNHTTEIIKCRVDLSRQEAVPPIWHHLKGWIEALNNSK